MPRVRDYILCDLYQFIYVFLMSWKMFSEFSNEYWNVRLEARIVTYLHFDTEITLQYFETLDDNIKYILNTDTVLNHRSWSLS